MEEGIVGNSGIKRVLADYAIRALGWLESGAGFIKEEIPKYIEEVLKWELAENIVYMFIFLLFGIISVFVLKWSLKMGIKKATEDVRGWYNCDGWIAGIVCSSLLLLAMLIGLLCQVPETIKIIVAPRVFLMEYLADFVKTV